MESMIVLRSQINDAVVHLVSALGDGITDARHHSYLGLRLVVRCREAKKELFQRVVGALYAFDCIAWSLQLAKTENFAVTRRTQRFLALLIVDWPLFQVDFSSEELVKVTISIQVLTARQLSQINA